MREMMSILGLQDFVRAFDRTCCGRPVSKFKCQVDYIMVQLGGAIFFPRIPKGVK
jgi:hypothetical protein